MATKVFRVSFELEVEDDGVDETAVEEAVTQAWDEEVLRPSTSHKGPEIDIVR